MKNLISKVALLLLCSVFVLSSCSDNGSTKDDGSKDKKTVTIKYRILVSADKEYKEGVDNGGIAKLYLYTTKEMDVVSNAHNTEVWTITETAETQQAAIAACDKKAIATFDAKLPAINAAVASVKEKFDAKKAELLSEITADKSTAFISCKNYGGTLFKGADDVSPLTVMVKNGTLVDLEAVGVAK